MNKYFFIISISILSGVVVNTLTGCRKERCKDPQNPNCENYDPCYGRSLENEILLSHTQSGVFPNWFQPDVRFWRGRIYFTPAKKIAGAKYTWYLGSEKIEAVSFVRNFNVTIPTQEQGIPVKLVIERPKQTDCFPNDDGLDTFERKIYFFNNYCETPMIGKFKVKFDNLKDSVIIRSCIYEIPRPLKWSSITDSCGELENRATLIWIGFNPYSRVYPDTTWNGMNSNTYYYYSSMILSSTWNGGNYMPYDGEFRVNPETWEVKGNYVFRDENHKVTPRIYFKGRKIQ